MFFPVAKFSTDKVFYHEGTKIDSSQQDNSFPTVLSPSWIWQLQKFNANQDYLMILVNK